MDSNLNSIKKITLEPALFLCSLFFSSSALWGLSCSINCWPLHHVKITQLNRWHKEEERWDFIEISIWNGVVVTPVGREGEIEHLIERAGARWQSWLKMRWCLCWRGRGGPSLPQARREGQLSVMSLESVFVCREWESGGVSVQAREESRFPPTFRRH